MRFDTLLTRADGPDLAAEVASLRDPRRLLARGLHMSWEGSSSPWQFQMVVDEPEQAWTFDQQGEKHRDHYSDGILHSVDGPVNVSFARSGNAAPAVRMLTPELLLQWGPPASYFPILVQRIGSHWLLFTFEHEDDPAQRTTLVVDERDGVARRSYGPDGLTVITEVRIMDPGEPIPPRPRFPRISELPALEY
jgi:hypothetical protein